MIYHDLPIQRASEDILNRQHFVNSIANVICNDTLKESFSIGLYGAWGTGKTSLINMIVCEINQRDSEVVVLRFNPWLCSDPKQLVSQFFIQLAAAIKLKQPALKAWEAISNYGGLLDATSVIPGYGSIIALAGKVLSTVASDRVERENNNIQKKKEELIKKLKEDKIKILVTIDDIDRLSQEEIIAVFQLIKSLADFPNTVYLLAFDYDVVVDALSKVQSGDGKAYLEKIVQVPFKIPEPGLEEIHNALFCRLNSIIIDDPQEKWDSELWSRLFHYGIKHYIKTLRDVTRFSNSFFIMHQQISKETDPVDLLGITCLQVFEPTLHARLYSNKEHLCGTGFSSEEKRIAQTKAIIEQVLNIPTVSNKEAAQNTLCILFPFVCKAVDRAYSVLGRNTSGSLMRMSIANSKCFDRYFSFALDRESISAEQLSYLINQASVVDLLDEMGHFSNTQRISRFIDEIQSYAENRRIPADRVPILLESILIKWPEIDYEYDLLTLPASWKLDHLSVTLLEQIDEKDRNQTIQEQFNNPDIRLEVLANLLYKFEHEHGRFTDKDESYSKTLPLEVVLNLERVFIKRAKDVLENWPERCEAEGLGYVSMLSDLEPQYMEEKKKQLVVDDQSFLVVLDHCIGNGRIITGRVTNYWGLMEKTLVQYISVEEAEKKAFELINSDNFTQLKENDQLNLGVLLLHIEKSKITDDEDALKFNSESIKKAIERYREPIEDSPHDQL